LLMCGHYWRTDIEDDLLEIRKELTNIREEMKGVLEDE
jgi:hypothetical protein